jgi:acyl-[acyl-carrier-protein]-phospholipid O-acyltransferase/long-chain-fatty-acid--[acyl-carrier-protein] ligase
MTQQTNSGLLVSRRFLPLFVAQFLGAMNDNVFKNALAILLLYRVADGAQTNAQVLVAVAAGLFMLPFFLFSATAGQLADKCEKSHLIRRLKLAEIVIMGLAAVGFVLGSIWLLLAILFLMGAQSALFGPLKYAILPDHLATEELVAGNGYIEAGTFLAILAGTVIGGLLIPKADGPLYVAAIVLLLSLLGWLGSRFIPAAPPADPTLKITGNIFAETWRIIARSARQRVVFLSILGISWFWLVGAMFLAQFPAYVRAVAGGDASVVAVYLTVFSVGIGIGSVLCGRLLRGQVDARYAPFGALGMSLFTLDFCLSGSVAPVAGAAMDAASYLSNAAHWRPLVDLLLIAICGGVFIVPLYALLQLHSHHAERSRMVAANNILNALFIVVGAAIAAAMLAVGFSVTGIFLTVAAANLFVVVYICRLIPDVLLKAAFAWILRLAYRVEVRGREHVEALGPRAVIIANHVSFLDGALLAAYLPGRPTFAVDTAMARRWWLKPFLKLFDALPVDPGNPMAVRTMVKAVGEGRHCVIFPEGRITVTGSLMKVHDGPGMIADKADAEVLPVRIDGAQFTPFSRLRGKVRLRLFPKIALTFLPPRRIDVPDELVGRERRHSIGLKLYDELSDLIYETSPREQTLFEAVLDARTIHGGRALVAEDIERRPISYNRLIAGGLVLGKRLNANTALGERIGLLLPNSIGVVTVFFALQAFGRIPAMLNYSAGIANLQSACKAAEIRTIVASRRFVELARLEDAAAALQERCRLIWLEDIRQEITPLDRLSGAAVGLLASWRRRPARPDDPAVVLFTSGSEGTPKGVVLSHRNILANCHQLAARVDFNATDRVLNALPVFHSFGLTAGMVLPLLFGIRNFLYPSPLHYRIVPALAYDINATILFGTDTFLAGYARMANPYDFYSLRHVFAGAEKVKPETRQAWAEKFGLRILEGYGATETSPALATNTPMHFRAGTVGRLLPGIAARLEPIPGIDEGGKLLVSGPNVMLGYLRAERPGVLERVEDGWYDTGDIVEIDTDGYLKIVGRMKRFAKIGGEMVSLGAVEELANEIWPDHVSAAVALPDSRKGEQIVLVTEKESADVSALSEAARKRGIAELMVPRTIISVPHIPLLGSGKVDYVAVRKLVEQPPDGADR